MHLSSKYRWLLLLAIALAAGTSAAAEPSGFEAAVQPFVTSYCLKCHNAEKQEGEFRLDTLSRDFASQEVVQRWGEILFRMNAGEMPPKKEPQPAPHELGRIVDWISARIKEGEAARMAKRGPVAHYRLSREEYANTVYDLLGVHYDVKLPGALNEDPRWHGFERIGSMLSLSPSHVDRYFKTAEAVLNRAFPEQPLNPSKSRRDAHEERAEWLKKHTVASRVRWPLWPANRRHLLNIAQPGNYRVRIQVSGLSPAGGRTPHLSLWHKDLRRSVFDQDIVAPEDQPLTLDFETPLSPGEYEIVNEVPPSFVEVGNHTLNVLNSNDNVFTSSRDYAYLNPTGYKLFDDDGRAIYPTLLVDWIESEGPLTSDADLHKRQGLVPASDDLAEARTCLERFATRAWRRPASAQKVERYVQLIEREIAAGETFRAAYRAAMVGVLTSSNFYYHVEGSANEQRDLLNDWELASRLSYFLWGSMPDDELFAAAQAGKLHEPEVLRLQLARMLDDPKSQRFTAAFPTQWLQLHKVGAFPPDPKLYPDYDKWLEQSMVLETTQFFAEVFNKNLPLREFLTSDWTVVNPRLALHYGLPALQQSGLQRVALRPEDHRGGLLTQASILSLTSDGTRHRPVHRGVWVSEAVFGRTPPSPPPNVEPLSPTPANEPKATIRMQLETHATHAICASCHRKIDPLGFAFDNFDAIGQWRTKEVLTAGQGDNPAVNADGVLPDGRAFHGPDEFKQLLAADVDRFAEAFVEQLATFGLRRVMTIDDAAQIHAIATASQPNDYKLRTVIENLVTSGLFRKR